ncbi:hypothetical protein LOTGIDRAFT_235416 [Lottia gigantea]|uniref:Uncharacterized protein n=1 Tax=Lottia gigantea TaxID=225164 RepID=V3ZZF6_LOTGI|nr:hypothetical protein LOTGIDRAFT_235416 [Lottia gigantea]ESO86366.1 hypothetical protein LOTGIDRAFT_235416 [Lottia gigantea]
MDDQYYYQHSPNKKFKSDTGNMDSGYWGRPGASSMNNYSAYSSFSNSTGSNQSSYNSTGWGRGKGRGGGGGGSSGYGGFGGGGSNYGMSSSGYGDMSSYEHNQPSSSQVDQMFKKFRKMEMMQEIAKLEEESEESMMRQRRNRPGPYGGGGYGFGGYNRPDSGFGRMGGYGRDFSSFDSGMGYRNDGWGGYGNGWGDRRGRGGRGRGIDRRSGNNRISGNDRRGPGGRERRKSGKRENTSTNSRDGERKRGKKPRYKPIDPNKPMDEESRDKRLMTLIEKIKTFEDRSIAIYTLEDCVTKFKLDIDIFFYRKTSCVFLDRLYFARGFEKPHKSHAYKQAIEKLRTKTLDEIKEDAENAGAVAVFPDLAEDVPKALTEEMRSAVTSIEMSQKPFKERLGLFIEAIKGQKHFMVLVRLYCTKYMINLITVYDYHPEETTDIHEARVYANEVLLSEAKGPIRKTIEEEVLNLMLESFKTKTLDEIMEKDGRFSQDYPTYPTFARHRGVGYQIETNAFRLRFSMFVNDLATIQDRDPADVVLFEDSTWDGSWVKILEESATFARLILKWIWSVEEPGDADDDDDDDEKEEVIEEKEEGQTQKDSEAEKILFSALDADITVKREEIAKVARREKCLVVKCQILVQDKLIGEGYGTLKNNATRMAAMRAYKNLMATQSAVYHINQKHSFAQHKWEDVQKRAKELKESLSEAPNFDHVKSLDVLQEEDIEKEDDLAPWAKEVVRRDLEKLSQEDILCQEDLVYLDTPMYIRDVIGHYLNPYALHMKSRFTKNKLTRVSVNKVLQDTDAIVKSLLTCDDKRCKGYVLEQVRKDDGTVEVLNTVSKLSESKLAAAVSRLK